MTKRRELLKTGVATGVATGLGFIAAQDTQAFSPISNYEYSPYDIRRYGAIGDGNSHPLSEKFTSVANAQKIYPKATSLDQEIDWAAAQKALDNNPIVYIPVGEFVFNSTLSAVGRAYKDKLIIGSGRASVIKHSGGVHAIQIGDGETNTSHLQLKDFKIQNQNNEQAAAGVLIHRASRLLFSNLRISGYTSTDIGQFAEGGAAIKIYQGWIITIRDCLLLHSQHGIYANGDPLGVNAVHIGDCVIENNRFSGVYIHGVNQYSVRNCTIESVDDGAYGVYVNTGRSITIAENYFENLKTSPIYTKDPVYVQGIQIQHNFFDAPDCDHMIIIDGAQGGMIEGNTFASTAKKTLIRLRGSHFTRHLQIAANSISNRLPASQSFIHYVHPLESGSVYNPNHQP